jgi:hypothetical protein
MEVSVLIACTVAPEMAAPEESKTFPLNSADDTCA